MRELLKLLVFESEEIYGYMYETLARKNTIELLGVLNDTGAVEYIKDYNPDVVLVGTKRLDVGLIRNLTQFYSNNSSVGLVILFASYSQDDIEILRKLAPEWHSGMALFLRQSLGYIDQLINIINAVSHGQVILDPSLAYLLFAGKGARPFLSQLTPRELEVLNLLAAGQTNLAIAKTLYIDVKTVEHHLNSIYSKIKAETNCDNKHPRVAVARLYLEEVGELAKIS